MVICPTIPDMSKCAYIRQELVDYVQNHFKDLMDERNWIAALSDAGGLAGYLSRMRREGVWGENLAAHQVLHQRTKSSVPIA